MMLVECAIHFVTFIIGKKLFIISFLDISPAFNSEDDNRKFFFVGIVKLILFMIRIVIQSYYLGKFLLSHHLPLFWVRD